MMTQTLALLLDAYRELNSKKLFWITLGLSLIVVGGFAAIGLNERGVTILHWTVETPMLNASIIPASTFYMFVFANIGIPVWLTWAASILALISTASIIPDFLAGGSVELTLARPIGRVRLFLTKYFTGLLFVALQVSVFTLACFLVIGIRGSSWEPKLFLAVPIVLVFFSYLFSICALLGLLTRSTIAALLLTLLAWVFLFSVNQTDKLFIMLREQAAAEAQQLTRRVDRLERAPPGEGRAKMLEAARKDLAKAGARAESWGRRSGWVFAARTLLPKTDETIALLGRTLIDQNQAMKIMGRSASFESDDDNPLDDRGVALRADKVLRGRSVWWIVGTSLLSEACVLALALWIFARRDF